MKPDKKKNYVSPEVQAVVLQVERGFAATGPEAVFDIDSSTINDEL